MTSINDPNAYYTIQWFPHINYDVLRLKVLCSPGGLLSLTLTITETYPFPAFH